MGSYPNTKSKKEPTLALFYCQNVPDSDARDRRLLEEKYGPRLRLFPLPCSGRLEPLHLLRALEELADAAYVITCPGDRCRYFEGNARAEKRVERTRQILSDIGLEMERVGIIIGTNEGPKGLAALTAEILDKTALLGISPVFEKKNRSPLSMVREGIPQGENTHDHG